MTINYCYNALWVLLVSSTLALAAGCSQTSEYRAQPTEARTDTGSDPIRLDIDQIFPPGPGRDLVLDNCQNCHVWTPIVILEMDEAAWYRNSLEHRSRVEGLTDEEFNILYAYLSSTFTPDRPVPKLPPELLEAWTAN